MKLMFQFPVQHPTSLRTEAMCGKKKTVDVMWTLEKVLCKTKNCKNPPS